MRGVLAPAIASKARAVACVLSMVGCGAGAGPVATAARGPETDMATRGEAATLAGTEGLASLEALAARGPGEAPLMREILRFDSGAARAEAASRGSRSEDVRAERDLCLRAVFSASRPVRAWFGDATGASRGEVATGTSGTVPPRGPACVTRGERVHLVFEGEVGEVAARAVVFAAP